MAAKSGGIGMGEGEVIILALVALGVWIFARGGVSGAAAEAAEAAAKALTDAAKGAATGAISGLGTTVGIPRVSELTDDPYIARWIIDQPKGGRLNASLYSTSSAFINALTIDQGAGAPPPPGSPFWPMFGETIDFGTGGASGEW